MNLRWISPLDPQATDVAGYAARLMPWLQRIATVTVAEDAAGNSAPAWWQDPGSSEEDAPGVEPIAVYHVGNNALHGAVHHMSLDEPGLVVLHDLSLVDLAKHLSMEQGRPEYWKEQMIRQYGEEVRGLVNRSEKSPADHAEMTARYPLFQPFVEEALGVVVHSRYARDAVLQQLPPGTAVRQLNMPRQAPDTPPLADYRQRPLQFVFCGHVGPNRRLIEFFEAWGQLEQRDSIRLKLLGNINNKSQLMQFARHFDVADFLEFTGYVSEQELVTALEDAHFALNLRWPTMGETSGSQLRYWAAALPALVTDVGWYAELPDDVVCKISPEREVEELTALLEGILRDPERYRLVGERGYAHLAAEHPMDDYARQLADFAGELQQQRLTFRTVDQGLVDTIAGMCDDGEGIDLFEGAMLNALEAFDPTEQEPKENKT